MADPKISIQRTLRNEDSTLSGKVTVDTGGTTRWGISQKCLDGDTLILTSDLRWIKIKDLNINDELIGFDEHPEIHGKLKLRRFRRSKVINIKKVILPSYRIVTEHSELIASEDHLLLRQYGKHRAFDWIETKNLLSFTSKYQRKIKPKIYLSYGLIPWKTQTDYNSGYLSGVLDGEGCVSFSDLTISQNSNECFDKIINILKEKDYSYNIRERKNKSGKINNIITFTSKQSMGYLKIIGELRSERLIKKAVNQLIGRTNNSKYNRLSEVKSVEFIGDHEVYAIETETKTLIANGFYSHNSYPGLDIKNLSLDKAIEIYKKDYWTPLKIDKIACQSIADAIYDMAVNAGRSVACKMAQNAIILSSEFRVIVDGVIGPNTLFLVNQCSPTLWLFNFTKLRIAFYQDLVDKDPKKNIYLKGWINRAKSYNNL